MWICKSIDTVRSWEGLQYHSSASVKVTAPLTLPAVETGVVAAAAALLGQRHWEQLCLLHERLCHALLLGWSGWKGSSERQRCSWKQMCMTAALLVETDVHDGSAAKSRLWKSSARGFSLVWWPVCLALFSFLYQLTATLFPFHSYNSSEKAFKICTFLFMLSDCLHLVEWNKEKSVLCMGMTHKHIGKAVPVQDLGCWAPRISIGTWTWQGLPALCTGHL
jgi:hypothetical protein